MRGTLAAVLVGMLTLAGCSKYQPAAAPPAPPAAQPQAKASPPAPAPAPTPPNQSGMTAGMTAMGGAIGMAPMETQGAGRAGVPPAGQSNQAPPASANYSKADVGSGSKGRGYGQGFVTTPVASYFAAREMIAFRIQVPDALRLYKAEHGSGPRTTEEFMEKIIKANRIKLPDLRPGERYLYDTVKEELMVEGPPR